MSSGERPLRGVLKWTTRWIRQIAPAGEEDEWIETHQDKHDRWLDDVGPTRAAVKCIADAVASTFHWGLHHSRLYGLMEWLQKAYGVVEIIRRIAGL